MKTKNYLTDDQVNHIRDKIKQFYPDIKFELTMKNNILKCYILEYKEDLLSPILDFYTKIPSTYSNVIGLSELAESVGCKILDSGTVRLNNRISEYYGTTSLGEMLDAIWNFLTYRNNIKQQNALPFYYVDFHIGKNKKQQFKVLTE